jgi:hypothetical protein
MILDNIDFKRAKCLFHMRKTMKDYESIFKNSQLQEIIMKDISSIQLFYSGKWNGMDIAVNFEFFKYSILNLLEWIYCRKT